MDGAQVHYEVFSKKTPSSGWALDLATENRATALATANDMMKEGKVAAVRVTKETLDAETREFQSVGILNLGNAEPPKKSKVKENNDPLCVSPQDLYTIHARDRIGRLLEGWCSSAGQAMPRDKYCPIQLPRPRAADHRLAPHARRRSRRPFSEPGAALDFLL